MVRHLQDCDVTVCEVRIPPRNKALDVKMAEKLIKAAWYGNQDAPPDKVILVVDLDGADPEDSLEPFRNQLPSVTAGISAEVLCAYAQQHLEAWYFADAGNLRRFLGGALGHVDTSSPDEIQNPKLHLKHLLKDRPYTARVSEEIARTLDAGTISGRSPSFKNLVNTIMNGGLERQS